MSYSDLFEFVKDYYTKHSTAPTRSIIEDKLNIVVPPGDGKTEYHIQQAKEHYVKHRVGNLLLRINSGLESESATDILAEMTKATNTLKKYTASAKDVNMTDVADAEEYFAKLRNASEDDRPGIKTGFKSLDLSYPTGLMPGQSLIAIGYSGHGKSLFTAKMAVNIWKQKKRVLVISLEMSPEEYRERVYALVDKGENNISMSDLATGKVSSEDFKAFADEHLLDANDFIVISNEGRMDVTPAFIQSKIDMYKPQFVLLDSL